MSGPGPKCHNYDWAARLSADDVTQLLHRINEKRNFVAAGHSARLPQAANMRKLVWSEELARFAQRWADQCDDATRPDKQDICRDLANTAVGQTIATISGPAPGLRAKSFVDVWFMQTPLYKGSVSYYNRSQDDRASELTQLIWAETNTVGCGKARFLTQSKTLLERLVCNFASRGNIEGHPVYLIGFGATQCLEGTAPDRIYPALCSVVPGSKTRTTVRSVPKTSPVSSLLRILNLSNNSVTQEIDPIKSSMKQSKVAGNYSSGQRNQKIRHVYLGNTNNTYDSSRYWPNVLNETAINLMQHNQFHQPERGHSRVYHGHQVRNDFTQSSYSSSTESKADLRKYDWTTQPYTYTTFNARKCNQNQCGIATIQQCCTRRGSLCQSSCVTPATFVVNKCTRGQKYNPCASCGGCDHKPPCPQLPPQSPPPPPPPPPRPRDPCYCPIHHPTCTPPQTNCICNINCHNSQYLRNAPRLQIEEIPDKTRRSESHYYDLLPSITSTRNDDWLTANPPKLISASYISPRIKKRNKAIRDDGTRQNRKEFQFQDYQVRRKLQYPKYHDEEGYPQDSSVSSMRRKRETEDTPANFKPFWQMDEYKYAKPAEMRALRYTTLLPNRRNNKGSRRTTISIVTEPITINIHNNYPKNNQLSSTEKFLSFEELMRLRKINPDSYNGRRSDDKTALTETTTKREMTIPSQPPPQKRCTRRLTCTWTMATILNKDGSTIISFDGGGVVADDKRTPYGHVEGCSRTSTCTRDYLDRNRFSGPSTEINADGVHTDESTEHADEEEYCERRELNVRRRNLEQNSVPENTIHESYSESLIFANTAESTPHQYETVTKRDCICKRNRNKRDSEKYEPMSVSCCKDDKDHIMSYGDLHHLVLNKIMKVWKTKKELSQGEHKCTCNRVSTVRQCVALLWTIFLFTLFQN